MTFTQWNLFHRSRFKFDVQCALLLAFAILISGQLATAQKPKEKSPELPELRFDTLEFRLKASDSWKVRSQVLSQVVKFLAQEGSLVQKGTPLVQLDNARAQLEYDAAEARFRRAYLHYRQTAAAGEESATGIAKAQKNAAGQLLRVAKAQLDSHVIQAPITGYLTEIHTPVGSIAKVGDAVLTLTIEEKVLVDAPMSRSKVSLGSKVAVQIGTQLYDAKVIAFNPPVGEHQRLKSIVEDITTATLEVPNRKHQLRRGDTVLIPQYPFILIPRQAIFVSPEGETSIYVTRKEVPTALPIDVNKAVDGGLFISVAALEENDVILAAPDPGTQASPDPLAGTVVFPVTETAVDVATLKEKLPDFSKSLQHYVDAVVDQTPDAPIPTIEVPFPADLQGILQNADYPLSEMNLDKFSKALDLTPDEIIAFEELKKEFNRRIEEQGLKIESVNEFKEIDSVETYMQFAKRMRTLNHDFANLLVSELDDGQAQQLQKSFEQYFGLANLSNPDTLSSLRLNEEQKTQLDKALNEIDSERFQSLQDLAKKSIKSQDARQRVYKLIDDKSKNEMSFLPEDLLATILKTELDASQASNGGKNKRDASKTADNSKLAKPNETPDEQGKGEDKESDEDFKRMMAKLRQSQAAGQSSASDEEVDYGFYALIGGAVIVLLLGLAYFTGFFNRKKEGSLKGG